MSPGRLVRLALILSPALALAGAVAWFVASGWDAGPADESAPVAHAPGSPSAGGRLVVLAVFDQMRGDYPDRWAAAFGPDGFQRMKAEGVWFANAMVPYACSETGPGHASIATGVPPVTHGIIANDWYDRGRGAEVKAWTADDRRYERVPPAEGVAKGWEPIAPAKLLAPTVGDALRAATAGKGRCVSLAIKARSAVLMGGKDPAAVYCFDTRGGQFHTSSYYREKLHPWVEAFNRSEAADRWAGKSWERLKDDVAVYDKLAGPDDQPGEYAPGGTPARTFPHRLPALAAGGYYDALERTPFANDMLWELAKKAIEAEQLGRQSHPDLLCLGFSATDVIGHAFGPDSQEVMDVTLRSDRLVAAMIAYLDEYLGRDRYTLVVTADHGVCPLPEVAAKGHPGAKRIAAADLVNGLDAALDEVFGPPDGVAGRWVEGNPRDTHPWVYLNRRTVEASRVPFDEVEKYARTWLANRADAEVAFGRTQLEAERFPDGSVGRMVQLAYRPDRCGDVYVLTKPYVLMMGGFSTGTSHGTPHRYDRHVPVLAVGAGVPKLGKRDEAVSSLVVAPLVAHALGVKPPSEAREKVPAALTTP